MKPRKSFAERNPVTIGAITTAALVLVLLLALNVKHLPFLNDGREFHALFTEAGGLASGDDVQVAGLTVGSVSGISLDHGHVRVDFTVTEDGVHLGSETTALISTETLLGKRGLELHTAGPGKLADGSTIPLSRTTPPYDLTDALSGLTTTTAAIDAPAFAKALRTISDTFQETPASLKHAVHNLGRITATIASRDQELNSLFAAAHNVSRVLAQRNAEISTLLGDGSRLLAELNARRTAIASLLVSVGELAQQLNGLVRDNENSLRPALRQLNNVVVLLNRNKSNIDKILDRAGPFAGSLGEAVSSGPFFQAYVQNLTRPLELSGLGGQ